MAQYFDTGAGDPTQCLGAWFERNVVPGIRGFYGQFGYFGYRAIHPFEITLTNTAAAGLPVHLVLGSNKGSLLESHLRWVLDIFVAAPNARVTVVAFSNAEFHPKTASVRRADGSLAGIVGSGNLTEAGMGLNVEAVISLDSALTGETAVIEKMITATELWRTIDSAVSSM